MARSLTSTSTTPTTPVTSVPGSRRRISVALAGVAAAAIGVIAAPSASATPAPAGRPAPGVAYVDVAVATVWTSPASPRAVDRAALGNPSDVPGWLAAMSPAQKAALTSRNLTQTQALYGQAVHVLSRHGGWVEVAVEGQPSPKNSAGYPGWVPARQLTTDPAFAAAVPTHDVAVIDHGLGASLYSDEALTSLTLTLSVGSALPVLSTHGAAVQVATPGGSAQWIAANAVTVRHTPTDVPTPTGEQLVNTALTFFGTPYLWAGRSAWGVDCSGLTSLVYQLHGITIPRDAGPQALDSRARRVAKNALEPGDLIFYGVDRAHIHHVALYAGDGQMIEAYDHTTPVRVTPVRFGGDYWGAVRYLA